MVSFVCCVSEDLINACLVFQYYHALLFLLPGGFLDQKSPYFQQEFPTLATGEEKSAQPQRKEDENKDIQYGPGPSLRPQSRCS